jgi:hypothetical protein
MLRWHHLAALALGLASTPLAAQQAAPSPARLSADWASASSASTPVPDVSAARPEVLVADVAPAPLPESRERARIRRPSFQIVTGLLGMVAGGVVGGTVMSRQCEENCGIKAFYGALGGSTLGFSMGFTLGRAAEGGDPAIAPPPRPVNLGS